MAREIHLNDLDAVLEELEYPVSRSTVESECADVTLALADGEANMADVIGQSSAETFASAEELQNELLSRLPRNAVGEPYQSEGEG